MAHGQDHSFAYPSDLSGFPKDTQNVLRLAHDLDWSLRWLGVAKHVVCITSPGREKSLNVPSTNVNANRMRSYISQIRRYSDPEKVEQWAEDNIPRGKKVLPTATLFEEAAPVHEKPVRTAIPRPPTPMAVAMEEAKASQVVKEGAVADRHVISEKPWMARRQGKQDGRGTMYESPFVNERMWSDGTVDYKCPTCDYSSDRPRSVSSHASLREDHPKGPQSKRTFPVDHYQASGEKKPSRAAVSRLASELLRALDHMENWSTLSREELAKRVAEAVYADRPEREAPPDLTPEQVIERIAFLVDGGRYMDMHQQVEAAASALREATVGSEMMTARLRTVEAEVERLKEERRVLAQMLSEEDKS